MQGERRRNVREPKKVKITVKGTDSNRTSFEEETETIDLSPSGLSFYLKAPIFVRALLSIEINSRSILSGKFQALVVRVDISREGKQFVAVLIL